MDATIKDNNRLAELLDKISRSFPQLQWKSYTYISEGWDHEVIILDDSIVFRFPTDQEYTEMLRTEIAVLDYLQAHVEATIPQYLYVPDHAEFAGYLIIPGDQLSIERFNALSPIDKACFGRQLAAFLTGIHNQPVADGILSTINTGYLISDQLDVKAAAATYLEPHLDTDEYAIVTDILDDIDTLLEQPLPAVFIHNDIYSRHLLWDRTLGKLGIIDFSDMCLGDPAADFAELYEYGPAFVTAVYAAYGGPKDPTFLDRAWRYQRWIGVYMMTDYFEYHKTTFKVARETFDRVKNLHSRPR